MLYRLLNKISRKIHAKPRRTKKKRNKLETSCWSYLIKYYGKTWWICSYSMAWRR